MSDTDMKDHSDWDIEKYHSEHEPKHHWELKREFMIRNKDRFDEQQLACMAQTLGNVEFMGCQYPQATMDLLQELSAGILIDFREKQEGKLKRTFVSGADAANRKVNRK